MSKQLYLAIRFRTPEGDEMWRYTTARVGHLRGTLTLRQRDAVARHLLKGYGVGVRILDIIESDTPIPLR